MRERRTRAQVLALEDEIVRILSQDNPQSVRHVFYRLTDTRRPVHVPKTDQGYRVVQNRLVQMRRAGALAYDWISDTSRQGYHVPAYDSGEQFVRATAALYRQTLWTSELPLVEAWCESRSIAGVLRDTCSELAVSLYPCGGFSSLTFAYEAADYANSLGRPVVVLYVGDHDPAGVMIDLALERELRDHLTVPLVFKRLAVTSEQIEQHNLPSKPRKTTELRRPDITATVEAEALPAGILRGIVRESVESYLPAGRLESAKIAEASERESLSVFSFMRPAL